MEPLARSSNGRTLGFGPRYRGSSPCRAASIEKHPYGCFSILAAGRKVWDILRPGFEA